MVPSRSDRKYTVLPIHIGVAVVAVGPRQLLDGVVARLITRIGCVRPPR